MELQEIKFSIVIPTFNREHFLREAILSVQAQGDSNWEIIVIDDGGTDHSKNMIDALEDERIHYFWQKNAERGAARNAGVQKSTGDYILFLDSDDFILPGYLSSARKLITPELPACVHIPFLLTDDKTKSTSSNFKNLSKTIKVRNQFASQVILRKDIAEQFPFSENKNFKIGEDWLLILKLTARFEWKIGSESLGRIRQHDDRSMHAPSSETIIKSKNAFLFELENDLLYHDDVALFKNIEFEFAFLELTALLRESAAKNEILNCLRKLIAEKPSFLFTKRFLFVLKKLFLLK